MTARLTQIASFSSGIPAQLARARLEAAGIPSFLTNEFGSIAGGGVGLQVSESDADRARELLTAPQRPATSSPAKPSEDAEVDRCIMCRSTDIESVDWALPLRVLRSLLLMVVPLPAEWLTGSRTRCGNCGFERATP